MIALQCEGVCSGVDTRPGPAHRLAARRADGVRGQPDALYQINVVTNGDAVTDVAFNVTFTQDGSGQRATVRRSEDESAVVLDNVGVPIIENAAVSFDDGAHVTEVGGYRFYAGLRSEPFFADFEGLLHDFAWTGTDMGVDKNVLAIVLEAPDDALSPSPPIAAWSRMAVRCDGTFVTVDRAGKPAIVNFFAQDMKEQDNGGEPRSDVETYSAHFVHVLEEAGGYSHEEAIHLADGLLPDMITLDRSVTCREPNGRRLDDDSIDNRIASMFNGRIPSHGLVPHTDLTSTFPYMGTPHPTPVPSGAA